jgi:histidinol phosphatase-like PHP family hydrolase
MTVTTSIPRTNLHNHTCFSTGFYRPRDIITTAIEGKMDSIGISDDFFITPISKEYRHKKDFDRLFLEDLSYQIQHLQELRIEFPTIPIFMGGVVDLNLNENTLPFITPLSNRFHYLLFRNVDQSNIAHLLEYRKKFYCPIGLCQNNLKANFPKFNIERLIQLLGQNKVFIELDTRLPYFLENNKFFNRVRGSQVRLTMGTDTHQDLKDVCQIEVAVEFIERMGLENNLLSLQASASPAPAPSSPRTSHYPRNTDYRRHSHYHSKSNDNYNKSNDNYNKSNDNYNKSNDNYNKSNDNYNKSNDNYNKSNDNYNKSNDNYNKSNDNYNKSNDNYPRNRHHSSYSNKNYRNQKYYSNRQTSPESSSRESGGNVPSYTPREPSSRELSPRDGERESSHSSHSSQESPHYRKNRYHSNPQRSSGQDYRGKAFPSEPPKNPSEPLIEKNKNETNEQGSHS